MQEILSVENMRKSDSETIRGGISGRELMFRAGEAIFHSIEWKPPVAIVCGVGNNAGDGYVLAGLLKDSGIDCMVVLLEDRFSKDGKYYFDDCIRKGIPVRYIDEQDCLEKAKTIVDCIFGTGFRGEAEGRAKTAIELINASGAYVVSVDINSGLNGDSGIHTGTCVVSDVTISIGSFKPGHFLNMAKDMMKMNLNCDIGIRPVMKPYYLLEGTDIQKFFKDRPNFSNKGTYGYTAIIGGSKKFSGAVRLASMANSAVTKGKGGHSATENEDTLNKPELLAEMSNAAMRSGAGVVKVGLPGSLYHDLVPLILESTVFPLSDIDGGIIFNKEEIDSMLSNVRTVAFGMGIGVSNETGKCLEYILTAFSGTFIVDADGLTLLARMDRELIRRSKCRLVLTPHIREFERLTGLTKEEILANPVKNAEIYALDTGAIVLLKGPSTIVTDGIRTYIINAGCSGMATAGSGDVLSGILSAVCGYIPDLTLAVAAGAYINGKAGERAQKKMNSVSMVASDTVSCIPEIITEISNTVTEPVL